MRHITRLAYSGRFISFSLVWALMYHRKDKTIANCIIRIKTMSVVQLVLVFSHSASFRSFWSFSAFSFCSGVRFVCISYGLGLKVVYLIIRLAAELWGRLEALIWLGAVKSCEVVPGKTLLWGRLEALIWWSRNSIRLLLSYRSSGLASTLMISPNRIAKSLSGSHWCGYPLSVED